MWIGSRPTSPEIVTFAQMQAQLKIDSNDEQQYISDLVDACTEFAESSLDASLLTRTITATFYSEHQFESWNDCHNHHRLYLPRGPVQSITSITDTNGQNITAFQQERHGDADYVRVKQAYHGPLTVVYVAGYGPNATDVPSDIRMAIRTHASTLWRVRESVSEAKLLPCPHSLEAFYSNKRRTAPAA